MGDRAPGCILRVSLRLAVASLLAVWLPVTYAQGWIDVTVELPTVERVAFDPRLRPPDMPSTPIEGGGLCRNVFEIEADIKSSVETLSPTTVRVYPGSFAITTRLKVTIFTVQGAPQKVRDHEEGHRMIGEYYYLNADAAAREAARFLAGQVFEASGVDQHAAAHAASEAMLAALKDAFMQRTHARSAAANARYDAITDHGRQTMLEADAVAAALASDP